MDYDRYDAEDAVGLAELVRAGETNALELVEMAIARIEQRNPAVNAVVTTRFDDARREAEAAVPTTPFAGVPFLVKALGTEVSGLPTTRGSRLFADEVAIHDSELIYRYRRAGLTIVGLTNTPELGKTTTTEPELHGPTRNPRKLTHSAGGSSGGAAAAVAAGLVPAAHGNDGGGSIRIPAAACGLFGLKPSRGRVSNAPAFTAFGYPLACHHALTRTVRDSAALLDAVAGPAAGEAYHCPQPERPFLDEIALAPGRLRIAVTTDTGTSIPVSTEWAAAADAMASILAELGHDVRTAQPSFDRRDVGRVIGMLMCASVVSAVDARLAQLDRPLHDDDLEHYTRLLYDSFKAVNGDDFLTTLERAEQIGRQCATDHHDIDVWITPTMATSPPELGTIDNPTVLAMTTFTGVYNVSGQPAMSIPFGTDAHGLPLGVQMAARYGDEATLLRLAAQLEREVPWPTAPTWNR